VLDLELLQLVEVARDRLPEHVADAVDADARVERLLVVGELVLGPVTGVRVVLAARVGVGPLGRLEAGEVGGVDVLEVVQHEVELAGDPGGVDVPEVVRVLVDRPLVVVRELDPAACGGVRHRTGAREDQGSRGPQHQTRAQRGRPDRASVLFRHHSLPAWFVGQHLGWTSWLGFL
jgi:hypothetical protein